MRILALDISKAGTGYAMGDGSGAPVSGVVAFSGHSRGQIGAAYAKWLRDLLMVEKPGLVACEAALFMSGPMASADTARLLLGLSFATEMVCELASVRHLDVPVQSWRKAFLGHGRPKDPKAAALAMCAMVGWDVGRNHNRADACGVFAFAHLHHGNRQAMVKLLSKASVSAMEGRP